MYTLCIGGMIFVALMPLFKGTQGRGIDSHRKTLWSKTAIIEQELQQAKDKALFDGIYPL